MSARSGLAACGVIALFAVAGCSSGGPAGPAGSGGPAGSAAPSWASSLGSGVTVIPPGSALASGSPGALLKGVIDDYQSGQYAKVCSVLQPSQQASCTSQINSVPSATLASQLPTFQNFAVGYTAIDGSKALVDETGTLCDSNNTPKCNTNSDPAAQFDSGKSFAALWSQATTSNSNTFTLSAFVKVNGAWYGYSSGS